jgi:hypothetical protein
MYNARRYGMIFAVLIMGHAPSLLGAVIAVTTTADTGAHSLRWAIAQAQVPGPDSIRFAIPPGDPGFDPVQGTWTIRPTSPLWAVTDGWLVIDGWSQARFAGGDPNPDGPEIEIDGHLLTYAPALTIMAPEVRIVGLVINRCKASAIEFSGASGGAVFGCYLGTTANGLAAAGNESGIRVGMRSRDIVIGHTSAPWYGNLIAGNEYGVAISDSCCCIRVSGNRIGVSRTEKDTISNRYVGVSVASGSDSVTIMDNLIGGRGSGVYLSASSHCLISFNRIGTDSSWNTNLGILDDGIIFDFYSSRNVVAGNIIGYCKRAGIRVFGKGSLNNRLTMNRISRVVKKGIETSFGANYSIAPPEIQSGSATTVRGVAVPGSTVEVFADDSSMAAEICGTTQANTSGAFVLTLAHPAHLRNVTATATDSSGNTSELSTPFTITSLDVTVTPSMPIRSALLQNYPNPFNASTHIRFRVEGEGRQRVRLSVSDLLGREVTVLVDEPRDPGEYVVPFNAGAFSSGVYYLRFVAGNHVETRAMLQIR